MFYDRTEELTMNVRDWEQHTLKADVALQEKDFQRSIIHYQQALAISETLIDEQEVEVDDLLTINVISCHNLAKFWRENGDNDYELKYLQLASEKILSLVPQCPKTHCDSFVDSLGCCRKALIDFMKRHPNPKVAEQVQHIDTATNCEIIASFRLN